MSYTREQRRRRKVQRIVTGIWFTVLLILCFCLPRWMEYIIVDEPAGVYAEVN